MVRRPVNQMDFWLGVKQKDVVCSTRWVGGQGMCGLGVWWAWWISGYSEMSKPRLLDHVKGDARAEG